jgi:hypothetical protein
MIFNTKPTRDGGLSTLNSPSLLEPGKQCILRQKYTASHGMKTHMTVWHIVQERSLHVALKSGPLVTLHNQFPARLSLITLINKERVA